MKVRMFVVDDDPQYARLLSYRLEKNPDYEVTVLNNGADLLKSVGADVDAIFLDIMMPEVDGLQALKLIHKKFPHVPVVMVSAQGNVETAIEAMKLGAYDYIMKGQGDLVKLDAIARNIAERAQLTREVETLRGEVAQKYGMKELVGDSPAMEQVYQTINKALRGDLTVAIQGESGTGKELVARAIHYNSDRKSGPFVVVNCAAIPKELMESEFFGHMKGSFTGAIKDKKGKFEEADGGTIFLDEIGEMDLGLQAKLLRALQNRDIQRIGGNKTIQFDARVISATNKDIVQMIRQNQFREDLYYRLFSFPIHLPPLRDRDQDALVLADHFLKAYIKKKPDFEHKRLSPEARKAVLDYAWPGNVRELRNAIERAILISDEDEISVADLMLTEGTLISPWTERGQGTPAPAMAPAQPASAPAVESAQSTPTEAPSGGVISLEDMERQAIVNAYNQFDGNVDKAAVALGIGRATMYRKLKKYNIVE